MTKIYNNPFWYAGIALGLYVNDKIINRYLIMNKYKEK